METFDPFKINSYTVDELVKFINAGEITYEELCSNGLNYKTRVDLNAKLDEIRRVAAEEDNLWANTTKQDTIPAYKFYLSKYPDGKHKYEAEQRIWELEQESEGLRAELFDKMREEPWLFTADAMRKLIRGISQDELIRLKEIGDPDVVSRYLVSGQRISYRDLIDNEIIPETLSLDSIMSEDYTLTQTDIKDLGNFPTESRTDVYFFGVPRGGKSSVLAGILSYMHKNGLSRYEPHYNADDKDMVRRYFNGLIESTKEGKFPISTAADAVSFMKFILKINNRENKLTFVELGGEAFQRAYDSQLRGAKAWGSMGAGTCLESNNRKLLFFIIDYSLKKGINRQSTESEQDQILSTALDILSQDGTGSDYTRGCTLSKVDTVAVIVTKSDLMPCERDERESQATLYLRETFANFMGALCDHCRTFGMNRPTGYKPYVYDFSLGEYNIGNTYVYDPTDSERIVKFISDTTSSKNTGFFGNLFGNN